MSWIVFAWIASTVFGLETIIGKLTSKHAIRNPWFFNFTWSLFILIFTAIAAGVAGVGMPAHWGSIVITGILYGVINLMFVFILSMHDITTFVPLYNFRTIFSVLLAALCIGEVLHGWQYVLIGIIVIGGVFSSMDERFRLTAFFRWQIFIVIIHTFLLALWSVATNWAIGLNDYWAATLWTQVVGQVIMLPTIPMFLSDVKLIKPLQYGSAAAMALASGVGTLAVNSAYASNVSITNAILSIPFSMVVAFVASCVAPNLLEKHTLRIYAIRFTAAAVMIVAAVMLSG